MLMEQGQFPSKIYLIHEGEFEILRKKRNQFLLIDPTKQNKMKNFLG